MRMPAEWERHEATWLTWPHNEGTWPNCLEGARDGIAEMIRVIATGERVELLVVDGDAESDAGHVLAVKGVERSAVRFHHVRTDDSWIRDYGPLFVADGDNTLAVDWRFNSWGEKYPPWNHDDAAGAVIGGLAGYEWVSKSTVLEGGSIDIDGSGFLLTTRQNVYAPNRGTRRGDDFFETVRATLGVHELIMLEDGIVGDDTDGHVDDITRFVPHRTIVTAVETEQGDANYEPLAQNLETLHEVSHSTGHRIVELPMPEPVIGNNGQRLPASYANFYIANSGVLVPTFGQSRDDIAIDILQSLFDDRPVVGIDARSLVVGLGGCHCLTMQQPAL